MKIIVKKVILIFLLLLIIILLVNILNYSKKTKIIQKGSHYIDASFTSDEYDSNLNINNKINLINSNDKSINILVEGFSQNNPIDKIDKILFINLNHRTDRLKQIKSEFKKMSFPENKIERISAVNEKYNGHIGCCKSHIKAMKLIIKNNYKYTMVFEDDFVFTVKRSKFSANLNSFFNKYNDSWDIIQLASVYNNTKDTDIEFIKKVNRASTSSAYIINNKFAKVLLNDLENSLTKMEKDMKDFNRKNDFKLKKKHTTRFALDQHWNNLQKKSQWFLFKPYIGKQGGNAGRSSIMSRKIEGFQAFKNKKQYKIFC